MDTSETYVKMCEKAEEIQRLVRSNPLKYLDGKDFIQGEIGDIEQTWLPRQDQLQGMVKTRDRLLDCSKFFSFACYYGVDHIEDIQDEKVSMEQLWLAFVMKEKHNKVWNGEQWEEVPF